MCMNLLCFGYDRFTQRALRIGKRELFNILSNVSSSSGVKLVLKLGIIKTLDEARVGDRSCKPEQVYLGRILTDYPVAVSINDAAILVDPESWFFGDVAENELRLLPCFRVLGNPDFIPPTSRLSDVLTSFEGRAIPLKIGFG